MTTPPSPISKEAVKSKKIKYPFTNMKQFANYCYAMDIKLKLYGNGTGDCMVCGTNYRILFEVIKKSKDEVRRLKKIIKNLEKNGNISKTS